MEAKAQETSKEENLMKKKKTSSSIYEKDAKTIQKRKIDEGHSNAAETLEHILQENQDLREAVAALQEKNEELENQIQKNQE